MNVFEHTNYRELLKALLEEIKQRNPHFSYRAFNRLAGIKSSGFLKLVIDGKRNLADEGIRMMVKGFKLSDTEAAYFSSLVKFNQATTHEEKNHYFKEMSKSQKFLKAKPLIEAQYELFNHWYYVAILELIRLPAQEVKNAAWLKQKINPPLKITEIKKAIKNLSLLGLLREQPNGQLERVDQMITTPDEVASVAVTEFHKQMCEMAAYKVVNAPSHMREFSSLTVAVSDKSFKIAKKEIQEFRKKLHSILEQTHEGQQNLVAHINLHLFELGGLV